LNPFWKSLAKQNHDLVCTANDVRLTTVVVEDGGPSTCNAGENVDFVADFCLTLSSTERYDIGLWLLSGEEQDLGNGSIEQYSGAYDGTECLLAGFPYYEDGDAEYEVNNYCGDILQSTRCIEGLAVSVPCTANENQNVNIPYCTSWKQSQHGPNSDCAGLDDIQPGSKSKCSCGNVEADIRICAVTLTGAIYQSCVGGSFDFEASLGNIADPDNAVVTWEITSGPTSKTVVTDGVTGMGSFTDLSPGTYEVKVSVEDGGCSVLDVIVAGDVIVYEDLSVDATLTGTCDSTFTAEADVNGGREGGSFSWKYAAGSEVGTVGFEFSTSQDVEGFDPEETGTVIAEVTYTEPCLECFGAEPCVATSTSDPENGPGTVYSPLGVSVISFLPDAVCVTPTQFPGVMAFTVDVDSGSGSYTIEPKTITSDDIDELTCDGNVCTADFRSDDAHCFEKVFRVKVVDDDIRCVIGEGLFSDSFSIVKETTYTMD
jgi:hypothetical protein